MVEPRDSPVKPQHASNFSKSVIHIYLLRNGQQLNQSYFDIKIIAVNVGLVVYFMWSKGIDELPQSLPSCGVEVSILTITDTTDFKYGRTDVALSCTITAETLTPFYIFNLQPFTSRVQYGDTMRM